MVYKPPTKVTTREMPYLALVTQVDPEFERSKHYAAEYEFKGRVFMADPYVRGSYNDHSNFYTVGQSAGASIFPVTADSTVFNADWGTATVDAHLISADMA